MEFGLGYWGPIVATAALLLGVAVAWLLLNWGRKITRPKPTVDKLKTYACGEDAKPEEVHVDSEQFFSPVRRVFKPFYRFIRPAHSGILSAYIFWVVIGLIVILFAIALALR